MPDILSFSLPSIQTSSTPSPALDSLVAQTQSIISPSHTDSSLLPTTLLDLLTQIIKPQFTTSHASLTSSGRKRLVPAPLTLPHQTSFSEHLNHPWDNPLTIPLLSATIHTYTILTPAETRKPTFEANFYLLVPPILQIIDHHAPSRKAEGYTLLRDLCETCVDLRSDILRRSGLSEVFVQSCQANFMMVPDLTPEEDSLVVLGELYPAFLAIVKARFCVDQGEEKISTGKRDVVVNILDDDEVTLLSKSTSKSTLTSTSTSTSTPKNGTTNTITTSTDRTARIALLTLLLRHAILSALSHLRTGPASTHPKLSTFLLTQLSTVIRALGIQAVKDFDVIIPLARGVLMDPFATAAGTTGVDLLVAALGVCEACVDVGVERVGKRWWGEILRAVVGGWCGVLDEEEEEEHEGGLVGEKYVKGKDNNGKARAKERTKDFHILKEKLNAITIKLGKVVRKDEWEDAKRRLVEEEPELRELFEGS